MFICTLFNRLHDALRHIFLYLYFSPGASLRIMISFVSNKPSAKSFVLFDKTKAICEVLFCRLRWNMIILTAIGCLHIHASIVQKFLDSSKLKRHFLTHTGERHFICPHAGCGKVIFLLFSFNFECLLSIKTVACFCAFSATFSCFVDCIPFLDFRRLVKVQHDCITFIIQLVICSNCSQTC